MSATIVIPSYRRPDTLALAVEALLPQLKEGDRCVVVVQGAELEREEVEKRLKHLSDRHGGESAGADSLQIIRQPTAGRAAARNLGLLQFETDFVVFIDDDSIARDGWLEALLLPLEEDRADLVAGRAVEDPDLTTNAPDLVGAHLTWTGHTRRNFNSERSGSCDVACSNNLAIRRDLAVEAGGFDIRFYEPAMYEDVEFSERLRRMGARIWYTGDAVVDHLVEQTGRWEQDLNGLEVVRAGHMSLLFRLHRPWGWPVMAMAYLGAAKWKVLKGRLSMKTIWGVAAALLEGWRRGRDPRQPLKERIDIA